LDFAFGMSEPLIVANCSAFFGDRLSAAAEMVRGGRIDVLTGDYLAELTMAILEKQRMKDRSRGFVPTFLKQMEEVLGECLDKKIRVVTNAGGLNPRGLAAAIEQMAARLGLRPRIAFIEGDDLMPRLDELARAGEPLTHLDKGTPLAEVRSRVVTANAYLGGWGIADGLASGADIVVCPRVTDAALVVGPAAWRFGWARDDWDRLAGAVAAGHIIECGTQATGGNYSFFREVSGWEKIGFPLVEMHADGSFVVGKHPGTGGLVSVGTVTAQLLYEIQGTRYLNPDVTARFDSLKLTQEGPDRVRVEGARGEPPPPTTKVCINLFGGHRNTMSMRVTFPDVEEKARIVEETLWQLLGGRDRFAVADARLLRTDRDPPRHNDEAYALLRVTVMDRDETKVGRAFSSTVVEMATANVPGLSMAQPPGDASPYLVYWPALVDSERLRQHVFVGGEEHIVEPVRAAPLAVELVPSLVPSAPTGATERARLGRAFGARSGDKGGNANLGVWARSARGYAWLRDSLTVERLQALLPDTAGLRVTRDELPNLWALNFNLFGILGEGVAASTRGDPQAKTLGEYLRAQTVDLPRAILDEV
jgi:hypothetical protein